MERIKREEIYKYKNRVFNVKVLEKDDGFDVAVIDEKTKKVIDRGKYSHDNYLEIRRRGISKDPADDLVAVMKKTVNPWVDKGLI